MKTIITLALIFFTIGLSAQTGSIVGKLTDKDFNNEPLPFANVIIKGTSTGTTSDIDGLYTLENVPVGDYTIVFSFVGYETVELAATVEAIKVNTINVTMGASAAELDEGIIKTTSSRKREEAF